jgi:hypothetical protein
MLALIADHQTGEILPHLFEGLLQHCQLIAADHSASDRRHQPFHFISQLPCSRVDVF